MDISSQFPALRKAKEIGQLWTDFFSLISDINKEECDVDKLSTVEPLLSGPHLSGHLSHPDDKPDAKN